MGLSGEEEGVDLVAVEEEGAVDTLDVELEECELEDVVEELLPRRVRVKV